MSEIDEIEVISRGGIPLYYHSNTGRERDNIYLLQASFITALTQFADELNNGEVKLISMEKKEYLLTKSAMFTVIFTSYDSDTDQLVEYRPRITETKNFLDEQLVQFNVDINDPSNPTLDSIIDKLDSYLREQDLVKGQEHNSGSFRQNVNDLIFRSVGYEPGKCNIGEAERMRRLSFGLLFFTLSLIGFAIVFLLQLSPFLVFLLSIPNFLGFLGLFQYFYQFCTTNALSQQYSMV